MGTIPFALSVSHFISSVGADAGFAAIIGLAILVLLYFAQARETASLRERSAESAEHLQQLELRLAQLARASAPAGTIGGPAPAPPPAGVQRTPAPAVAAAGPAVSRSFAPAPAPVSLTTIPSAPAGVGAPALSAATRLIPNAEDGPISIRATGAAAATAPAAAAAAGSGGRDRGGAVIAPPGPPPATAAGNANGGTGNRIPARAPAPAPAPASIRTNQPPRPPARATGTRTAAGAPRRAAPEGRSGVRFGVLLLAGLVGLAVIVAALLLLTSSGASTNSSSSSAAGRAPATSRHRTARANAGLKPSAVSVVVLNGTSTTNLAHDVTQRLAGAGYKMGTPETATDQTLNATVVGYLPGHRRAALVVARSLKLGSASVQPVDPSNQAVACPQSSACTAQVVVTVGSDLASAASTSTPTTTT